MTGRHAGTPDLTGLSILDQATACREEILAFMVARASAPLQFDIASSWHANIEALIQAEQIMNKAAMIFGAVADRCHVELAAEFDRVYDLAGDPPEYQPDEDSER